MTRRRKILIAFFIILIPVLIWLGPKAFEAYAIVRLVQMIQKDGLDFTFHFPDQTVGQWTDKKAQYNYEYVTDGLGFGFPHGTLAQQYDDAWGHIYCCFILPEGHLDNLVAGEKIQRTPFQPETAVRLDGLNENTIVPTDAIRYVLAEHSKAIYPIIYLYVHAPSSRVWVDYGYVPPYESVPDESGIIK